jgi:hypothetical protein
MAMLRPALLTQRAVRRLPRGALVALCAAYLLPGVVGRDPWRSADLAAYAQMLAMAEGRVSWWLPTLGGATADLALLPHWLGAAFIVGLGPLLSPPLAARLAFALLLGGVLWLVWSATRHLASTEAAQPVPFAFGGEADPSDYSRAIADTALLALMATLGLLQLGHETTPELGQLFATTLLAYGLAAAPFKSGRAMTAIALALPMLAGSGAPTIAMLMGAASTVVCRMSSYPQVRRLALWPAGATAVAALVAGGLGAWHWRLTGLTAESLLALPRQWAWFMWPTGPLALWALWRWRRHLQNRHLSVPLTCVVPALIANVLMDGSDRALLLGLPGLAMMSAFALPTMKRAATAAIDWFSVFFFSACALAIWVIYLAMLTGIPAKPASNVAKLAPGFTAEFSAWALAPALVGTASWLLLVRWRTGRHREAVWKSMVLPAGGVALCWLLLMTLWLPLLDYARSSRPWVTRVSAWVPAGQCIAGPQLTRAAVAALEVVGRYVVDAGADALRCPWRIDVHRRAPASDRIDGWIKVAELRRPTDRDELTLVYRRAGTGSRAAD